MTIRDEYEYLKSELMVKLEDTTVMCNLDFPFDFKISKEEVDRYFMRGLQTRATTKRTMIMLDNTYKKVRLFPSEETTQIFIETRDAILEEYKKSVLKAFEKESWRFNTDDIESFSQYIDDFCKKVIEASEPYIEKLKTLTPEDIKKEIEAKDNFKKTQTQQTLKSNNEDGKGLF